MILMGSFVSDMSKPQYDPDQPLSWMNKCSTTSTTAEASAPNPAAPITVVSETQTFYCNGDFFPRMSISFGNDFQYPLPFPPIVLIS